MSRNNIFQDLAPSLTHRNRSPASLRKLLFGDGADNITELIKQIQRQVFDGTQSRIAFSVKQLATRYFLEQKAGVTSRWIRWRDFIYDLSEVEESHENYLKNHKVVCHHQIKNRLP